MTQNTVHVSMRDENNRGCSYAMVEKNSRTVIILLREKECAIFDRADPHGRYLLLKHYASARQALQDFYKLIGKMCAKAAVSKYFSVRKEEDNRMVMLPDGSEHMLHPEERKLYDAQLLAFNAFAAELRGHA